MSTPELKSVDVPDEIPIPDEQLKKIHESLQIEEEAMGQLGRLYLDEAKARKALEQALELLRVARESAVQAQQLSDQVARDTIKSLGVNDGSWDLDLGAGKLVRINGGSGN